MALRLLHAGQAAEAASRFAAAAALWQPYHRRGELRCEWAAGEASRRGGGIEGAVARLVAVEARAEELGMVPLLGRIRRSLRAAGKRRSAARAADLDWLTAARWRCSGSSRRA